LILALLITGCFEPLGPCMPQCQRPPWWAGLWRARTSFAQITLSCPDGTTKLTATDLRTNFAWSGGDPGDVTVSFEGISCNAFVSQPEEQEFDMTAGGSCTGGEWELAGGKFLLSPFPWPDRVLEMELHATMNKDGVVCTAVFSTPIDLVSQPQPICPPCPGEGLFGLGWGPCPDEGVDAGPLDGGDAGDAGSDDGGLSDAGDFGGLSDAGDASVAGDASNDDTGDAGNDDAGDQDAGLDDGGQADAE
jgi:hypothetical protein